MQDRQFGQWLTSLLSVVHQSVYNVGQTDNQRRLNKNENKLSKEQIAYQDRILALEQGFLDKSLAAKQLTTDQRDQAYKDMALYVGITVVGVGIIIFSGVLYSDKKKKKVGKR